MRPPKGWPLISTCICRALSPKHIPHTNMYWLSFWDGYTCHSKVSHLLPKSQGVTRHKFSLHYRQKHVCWIEAFYVLSRRRLESSGMRSDTQCLLLFWLQHTDQGNCLCLYDTREKLSGTVLKVHTVLPCLYQNCC